ncbi:MAG: hypothetical protein F7C07_07700 [Desulfurococcales archaeon]|nr:hypothetical protein [Desulfurococcales archaeon]
MKMLLLHAKSFSYKTLSPAVDDPPDPSGSGSCSNCLVVMVSVEAGDGYSTVREACSEVASWAGKIGVSQALVYPYAHLSRHLAGVMEAQRLLEGLSKCLDNEGLRVSKAPLGWYKEFSLELHGHPLAEAFREVVGEPLTVWSGGESIGFRRAVERGILESYWLHEKPEKSVSDVMERLCLGQSSNAKLAEYTLKLERWLGRLFGYSDSGFAREEVHVGIAQEPRSLLFLVKACSLALSRELPLALEGCRTGDLVVALEASAPLEQVLDKLSSGVSGRLAEISIGRGEPRLELSPGAEGRLVGYRHADGGVYPLALLLEKGGSSIACIGPLYSVIKAILSNELLKATRGEVPTIPAWLHHYQAAIIPVTGSETEYARRVALELARRGASVLLLSNTGERLGARIRYAATRWIPYIVVAGKREAETETVSVRRRWEPGEQEVLTLDSFMEELGRLLTESPILTPRLATLPSSQDAC